MTAVRRIDLESRMKEEMVFHQEEKNRRNSGNKRSGADDLDEADRCERKRQREKQRRNALTNAFDELDAFVSKHEGLSENDKNEASKKMKRSTDSGENAESSGLTRVDLIGKALEIMKRQQKENKELEMMLSESRERANRQSDEVIMMIPRLTYVDDGPHVSPYLMFPPPSRPQWELQQGGGYNNPHGQPWQGYHVVNNAQPPQPVISPYPPARDFRYNRPDVNTPPMVSPRPMHGVDWNPALGGIPTPDQLRQVKP